MKIKTFFSVHVYINLINFLWIVDEARGVYLKFCPLPPGWLGEFDDLLRKTQEVEKRVKRGNFYCTCVEKYHFGRGGGKNVNYLDNIYPCNLVKKKGKDTIIIDYDISEESEQYLGMCATYSLFEWVKENLDSLIGQ